mmetsp:Transcript_1072/g.2944  ORF Transcript_1072/g.2944 Transcript_1072/m.2944 type:complete len:213 (-) Transcript_1072:1692-2330(-)
MAKHPRGRGRQTNGLACRIMSFGALMDDVGMDDACTSARPRARHPRCEGRRSRRSHSWARACGPRWPPPHLPHAPARKARGTERRAPHGQLAGPHGSASRAHHSSSAAEHITAAVQGSAGKPASTPGTVARTPVACSAYLARLARQSYLPHARAPTRASAVACPRGLAAGRARGERSCRALHARAAAAERHCARGERSTRGGRTRPQRSTAQ